MTLYTRPPASNAREPSKVSRGPLGRAAAHCVVDYHGSRLVALERVRWPSTTQVVSVLREAIAREGAPQRILTDRGPIFRSEEWKTFLTASAIEHTLTLPGHPWTNGRIERLFRTFKETVFGLIWTFVSAKQIDRLCEGFRQFYNRDRPHSSWDGRTPDEVWCDRGKLRALGAASYLEGRLDWYALG